MAKAVPDNRSSSTAPTLSCTLELGTKPPDLAQADDSAGERGKGETDVGTALVADTEAPEAGEPGEAAFHHPPVPSEMGAAVDATACDARFDPTNPALPVAAPVVVAHRDAIPRRGRLRSRLEVGVPLVRALAWPTAACGSQARHGVQGSHQHHAVVPVGAAQRDARRRAAGIGDEVAFRAWPGATRRVRADLRPPPFLQPGWRCRARLGSSSTRPRCSAAPAAHDAAGSRPRLRATRRACASTSCRSSLGLVEDQAFKPGSHVV